jgi:thiol:disulfide interchange protein DsbD
VDAPGANPAARRRAGERASSAGLGVRLAGRPDAGASELHQIKNVDELNSALAQAKGKPVMLDLYADWCVACKEFEKYTFSDPQVQNALKETVLLQANVTANNAQDKALLKQLNVLGLPTILFFNEQGKSSQNSV